MPKLNLAQALNQGLDQALEKDDSVVVFGEDVGKNGGVFRITDGLQKKFGKTRVDDTPLAELGIVGAAVGMAMYGLRPVAEIQFEGFMPPAMDQFLCHMGRLRDRTKGKTPLPLVVRAPHGGLIHAPEHHSESPEAYFTHTPGLKVVIPSCPEDAKGLLMASIADPDPVIFFEPKRLYRAKKEEVSPEPFETELGKLRVAREGEEISLVAWGAMVETCLKAAELLEGEGVSVEVLDLRTLSPLDLDGILASVQKTGRLVIASEAPFMGGVASDISALVSERAILKLLAPVRRVTSYDCRMPLYRTEKFFIPDVDRIINGIKETLEF